MVVTLVRFFVVASVFSLVWLDFSTLSSVNANAADVATAAPTVVADATNVIMEFVCFSACALLLLLPLLLTYMLTALWMFGCLAVWLLWFLLFSRRILCVAIFCDLLRCILPATFLLCHIVTSIYLGVPRRSHCCSNRRLRKSLAALAVVASCWHLGVALLRSRDHFRHAKTIISSSHFHQCVCVCVYVSAANQVFSITHSVKYFVAQTLQYIHFLVCMCAFVLLPHSGGKG